VNSMRSKSKNNKKVLFVIAFSMVWGMIMPAFVHAQNWDTLTVTATIRAPGEIVFEPNVRVDDSGSSTKEQTYPAIAVDADGNIYAAWNDRRNNRDDIYFTKSTDGGTTFGPNLKVNDSSKNKRKFPSIAVDPRGNIYVAWHDERSGSRDIYFAKSTDGGMTFGTNTRVDDTGASASAQSIPSLSIIVDMNENIYLAWYDNRNGNNDIYFAKSTDGGATFEPSVRVDDTGASISVQAKPSVAIGSNGDIYVTWHDKRNGSFDIYFAKSADGGATFGPNIRVDDSGTAYRDQFDPRVVVDKEENIYVIWHDYRHRDHDIYFAKSTDGGDSFGANVRVDDTAFSTSFQLDPAIALDRGGNIYTAWHDKRNGNYDIYFAKSTDGGATFGSNIRVDDTGAADSLQRSVAITVDISGNIYVIWHDDRNGNFDIYFAMATEVSPLTPTPILPQHEALVNTLTPAFEWSAFQDGGDGDTQDGYQLRVRKDSDDAIVYDTGYISDISGSTHTYDPGAYAGIDPTIGTARLSDPLTWNTNYYWHVRYRDSSGQWSNWTKIASGDHQNFYTTSGTNIRPNLLPIGNKQGVEGEWFIIKKMRATDKDGDPLTIEPQNLPSGARFFMTDSGFTQTGASFVDYKLRWPGEFVKEGIYTVTFTASDGAMTESETITITITGVGGNNPPVLASIGNRQGREGETFVIAKVTATDPDADAVTLYADNLPGGASFFHVNSGPGFAEYKLRWSGDSVKGSERDIVFTASDGKGGVDQEFITVSITGLLSASAAPLSGVAPLDVDFQAELSNGWAPVCTWDFGDGNQATGQSVTHTFNTAGDYNIILTASDGLVTAERTLTVRVFEDNPPQGLGDRGLFVWKVWNQGHPEGWSRQGGLTKFDTIGDGTLNTTAIDVDAYMESPVTIIDASVLNTVSIRYKIDNPDVTTGKFAWRRAGQTAFESACSEDISIIDDGAFHIYTLDLSSHPEWTGYVVEYRFYPTTGQVGHSRIDYIRIAESTPSSNDVNWEFNPSAGGLVSDSVKRQELLDFCRIKGITHIFLNSQGAVYGTAAEKLDFTSFISAAHGLGMDVYALQGRKWWSIPEGGNVEGQLWTSQEGWQYVTAVMNYGQFDAIIDDTEPYTANSDDWNNNLNQRAQWYVDWVQGCKDVIAARVPFVSVVPFWFDTKMVALNGDVTPKPLNEYVSDIADSSCIMDYRDSAEGGDGMIQHAENEITYAPCWAAVETQNVNFDKLTFYEEGEAYMEGELQKFKNYYNANPNYLGMSIHYYIPYKEMKP